MFLINSRYRLYSQRCDRVRGFIDYEANDIILNKRVVLRMSDGVDAQAHRALVSMAHFLRRLNGSCIQRVLDCGLDLTHHPETMGYLVMSYPQGTRLDRYLKRSGPLSIEQTRQILSLLISGLEHAHKQGIFHGNLKTKNIWLSVKHGQYHLQLSGFGDAVDWSLERPTYVRFTPDYGAPEQFLQDHPVGTYTDIYALGLIALRCLGHQYEGCATELAQMMALAQCYPVPREISDGPMGRVLECMLRKNISDQTQPMRALDLDRVSSLLV